MMLSLLSRGSTFTLFQALRATSASLQCGGPLLKSTAFTPTAVQARTARAMATTAGKGKEGLEEENRKQAGATKGAEEAYAAGKLQRLFDLTGRKVFVTGAARGMGSWIAMGMARAGADVALADMGNEDLLAGVAEACRQQGRNAIEIKCDVRDRPGVEKAIQRTVDELGGVDVLVANAGILGKLQPADKVGRTVWHDVMETNVAGVYHCARAVYPHMKASGGGKIIIMSSIAGIRGFGAQVAYCASKGALIPLSKSLAVAWGKDNIQVNCLLPGAINTPFLDSVLNTKEKLDQVLKRIPLGRLGVSEDIVGPAVFLASHASDYVTGAEVIIDGGGTCLPMLTDQDPEAYKV